VRIVSCRGWLSVCCQFLGENCACDKINRVLGFASFNNNT